jgi:NAD(P)-dependent dehydrogenase (short-subunit alcohol dehydrogenase family)
MVDPDFTATDGIWPLTGQVAIVTGAGRGLGQAVALRLAEAGAQVAVASRTPVELSQTVTMVADAGGRAVAFEVDVTDEAGVKSMVDEVERQFGSVDLLVNDAGIIGPLGPAWEATPVDWWRVLETNVRGAFLCAHAVLPGMIERRGGRIVNVASGAGIGPARPFAAAYSTSKAALIRLSETLAIETSEYGVSVFSINPGWMSTDMTSFLAHSEQGKRWSPWAPQVFGTRAHVPVERAADLVAQLASGRADQLTGRYIEVFDDLDELIGQAADIKANNLYSLTVHRAEAVG